MPKTQAERVMEWVLRFPLDWAKVVVKDAWGWENLDLWQMKVIASADRHLFLNCSRQSGKSSVLAIKMLWKALTEADALILIIAEQRQSNEDIRKVKQLAKAFDTYLSDKYDGIRFVPVSDNITSVEFSNGSRIIALPANEKIRGFSAPTMIVMDEAAYQPDEVFVAVDPMMTVSHGQLILASTPNGTSGFYHTEYRNPRYTKIEVPWWDCPRIKEDEIQLKKQLYGEAYVKQEYQCEFLDDVAALFTERALRDSIDDSAEVFQDQVEAFEVAFNG